MKCLAALEDFPVYRVNGTGERQEPSYWNSTSVVMSIAPLKLLATGQLSACISSTRATVSRTSSGSGTRSL